MARRSRREAAAWIALLSSRIAPAALIRLASFSRSAEEILELADARLRDEFRLTGEDISRLRTPRDPAIQESSLEAWERHGMRLITLGEPEFPRGLAQCGLGPAALFVRGEIEEDDYLAIGVVGSREASSGGLEMAARLSRELTPAFTIVSGLAVGIDSASHRAALEAGGRTIGVAACGLDIDYPARNRELREFIAVSGRGALVSPFLPGTPPMKGSFAQRNHVLAAISLATVVVEAAEKSGALVTARAAGEMGRQVFAVPGDPTKPTSAGANGLLRDGATLCTCAADIIADLEGMLRGEADRLRAREATRNVALTVPNAQPGRPRAATAPAAPARAPQPAPTPPRVAAKAGAVTPLQRAIIDLAANADGTLQDEIANALVPETCTLGQLSEALLMLEMDGRIRRVAGGRWVAL